jgi:nitrite reductase (NO-forming)
MPVPIAPLLSDLISTAEAKLSRRGFLATVPVATVLGAAACNPRHEDKAVEDQKAAAGDPATNSNSRLDTALVNDPGHATAVAAAQAAQLRVYDAALPPLQDQLTHKVHWRSREVPVRIRPDLAIAAWTFEGDVPGPILHVRQGDTIEFTLTNEGTMPHSSRQG